MCIFNNRNKVGEIPMMHSSWCFVSAEFQGRAQPHPKPRVEGLAERSLHFMKENHCIRNTIERHGPGPVVQVNSYPVRARTSYSLGDLVVLKGTSRMGTVQSPGFGVVSQLAVAPSSTPIHGFVADSNGDPSTPAPFYLPVAATSHASSTQHLSPVAESIWVLWVGLGLRLRSHTS